VRVIGFRPERDGPLEADAVPLGASSSERSVVARTVFWGGSTKVCL